MREFIDTRPLRANPIITGHDTIWPDMRYRRDVGLEQPLIVLCVAGSGPFGRDNWHTTLRAGDAVLLDPHTPLRQSADPPRGWTRHWAIFEPRPHWYPLLDWPVVAPGIRHLKLPHCRKDSPARVHLAAMHLAARGSQRRSADIAMNHLEAALLAFDEINPRSQQSAFDSRVQLAMDFMTARLHRRISLADIAAAARISAPHLARLFRAQVGHTPMQFLERLRIARAVEHLEMTAAPIESIAHAVGFDDPFYFSTRFKQHTTLSPRAFRNRKTPPPNNN